MPGGYWNSFSFKIVFRKSSEGNQYSREKKSHKPLTYNTCLFAPLNLTSSSSSSSSSS